MDATAELQHVIREARHDAWGVRETAMLLLKDAAEIGHKLDLDERRLFQLTVLGNACKASLLFAQLDNAPTTVLTGMMRVVAIDREETKVRGGQHRKVGERDSLTLANFAKQHGLLGESHVVWMIKRVSRQLG